MEADSSISSKELSATVVRRVYQRYVSLMLRTLLVTLCTVPLACAIDATADVPDEKRTALERVVASTVADEDSDSCNRDDATATYVRSFTSCDESSPMGHCTDPRPGTQTFTFTVTHSFEGEDRRVWYCGHGESKTFVEGRIDWSPSSLRAAVVNDDNWLVFFWAGATETAPAPGEPCFSRGSFVPFSGQAAGGTVSCLRDIADSL